MTVGYPYRDTCPRCGAHRIDAQIGLEPTPAEYVAHIVQVMRECWRVLKDDGVMWLNLGDSYNNSPGNPNGNLEKLAREKYRGGAHTAEKRPIPKRRLLDGLKPKDLVGIPWMVAKALQQPFYTGRIAEEKDRVWLAAIIDAEGTICGFTHQRKDDGNIRTGVHVAITNSNRKLLDEAHRIWPASLSDHGRPGDGHLGKMETWRWIAHNVDDKSILMREMYPYLIAKKKQALLAYNLFEISKDAKRLGKSSEAKATHEKRSLIVSLISKLNHLEDVDIPNWCIEPPSLCEPGWYLRSDVIWAKPNPMPESVTDRPTKAHEYVFLLTKQARYYYDAIAISEPSNGQGGQAANFARATKEAEVPGQSNKSHRLERDATFDSGIRNRRSVWTVATQPYSGAHFATFPPALIEPMILAGTSARGECPQCGKAWVRVVERESETFDEARKNRAKIGDRKIYHDGRKPSVSNGRPENSGIGYSSNNTIGWRPQCECRDLAICTADHSQDCLLCNNSGFVPMIPEPIPQTVLDPFAGSGTTGAVAVKHGRCAVLFDLNAKYIDLQFDRTNGVQMVMPT